MFTLAVGIYFRSTELQATTCWSESAEVFLRFGDIESNFLGPGVVLESCLFQRVGTPKEWISLRLIQVH